MFDSRILIALIPALPLLAAVLTAVLGPRILQGRSHWPTIAALAVSFLCSLLLADGLRRGIAARPPAEIGYEQIVSLWTWADIGGAVPGGVPMAGDAALDGPAGESGASRDFAIDVALRVDSLTVIMLMMVTLISLLVAIYSRGYMLGDRGYWRFYAYVSLFVFSMTMLVSVSNFLLLYVFWEAVGVCSYLLIGFWYERPAAAAAGKKAFLVNRVGDFGFALALFLIWTTYGTWNFHDTVTASGVVTGVGVLGQTRLGLPDGFVGGGLGLAICLLLMLGACGKSAQFPLHVWLPDAMEGPTPVSALIHAATMVTAGVYMVARCTPLFVVSPTAQMVVACTGAGTALMAGIIALTQFDLKRVLAYSTISQLGYMFLALGTGTLAGISAGMFHLFTHAFFKALLFLGAGSVMHAMGGVIDMRKFRGLRRVLPITCWTFAVGCLALAGLFPLSGFWSKDAILGSVHDQAHNLHAAAEQRHIVGDPAGNLAGNLAASSSLVTASTPPAHGGPGGGAATLAYLERFSGSQLEWGQRIYGALYYVALATALLTTMYTFRAFYMTFCGDEQLPPEAAGHAHESPSVMWVPLAVLAAFALAIGYVLERTHIFHDLLSYTPMLATAGMRATPQPGVFHQDIAVASTVLVVMGLAVASYLYLGDRREVDFLARLFDSAWLAKVYRISYDKFFVDEIYAALIVLPLRGLAWLSYQFDRWIVDGLVNLVGWIPRSAGALLRGLQMGLVPFYGLAMVLGMLTLLLAKVVWGWQ